jgi:preprotein translocase subunit YajC
LYYTPLIILAVFVIGALIMNRRSKQRSAETDARMRREITVGSQVMTTSGLYGTVVALNSDDTVILAIAPGIEVRWAFAALRDADALPPRYRRGPIQESTSAQPSRSDVSDDSS